MGLLELLGLGRGDHNLVVLSYEGPNHFRLNGNRKHGKSLALAKRNAAAHDQTICWMEFNQSGKALDQGLGPAAEKIGREKAAEILRGLPTHPACKKVLIELEGGMERTVKVYS